MDNSDHIEMPDEGPNVELSFAIADGITPVAISELPSEVLDTLRDQIHADEAMPEELKTKLLEQIDHQLLHRTADHDEQLNSHSVTAHRERIWNILDSSFPAEPHLWSAMEKLFAIAAGNPRTVSDESRRELLEESQQHIRRHLRSSAPALSPEEQIVADFRTQLGD